jgi:hypothetical protein
MAIDIPVQQLIDEIGHDGSEKIFKHMPEPMCRRGFHSQELIQAAWLHGLACTPFEMYPMLKCSPFLGPHHQPGSRTEYPVEGSFVSAQARFVAAVRVTRGVMEGTGKCCEHAVYYHYGQIWDPDGEVYMYSPNACEERGFYGNRLWMFTQQ